MSKQGMPPWSSFVFGGNIFQLFRRMVMKPCDWVLVSHFVSCNRNTIFDQHERKNTQNNSESKAIRLEKRIGIKSRSSSKQVDSILSQFEIKLESKKQVKTQSKLRSKSSWNQKQVDPKSESIRNQVETKSKLKTFKTRHLELNVI
mmetsp:Transcript_16400/g.37659  ORF Transcript_16400/g.37659 Transcript_16400/m.37659 type:complete len:146 (-) Transcript_16400:181-618(-)